MMAAPKIGIRWTIGHVSAYGFETLRLSIWGAWKLFGPEAAYGVCVNSLALHRARELTGPVPEAVLWYDVTDRVPPLIRAHTDGGMAEGVGWKLAPLRLFSDRFELALDNDCILWKMPSAVAAWLAAGDDSTCLLAEDVRACFGAFISFCGEGALNSGIRGLPPRFDLEAALQAILTRHPVTLRSELDEQGLQIAALSRGRRPLAVSIEEVTICSPFPPHLPHLGRAGAHFVGLNVRESPWRLEDGRPAVEAIRAHWSRHRETVYDHVGVAMP
jgi:hypothetical protein